MDDFVYHHPIKIIFGSSKLDCAGSEVAALGDRVLLVYGQSSIKNNGIHRCIVDNLAEHNLEITEFSGVQSNPLLSDVHNGIKTAREHNCNVVLAVGGGSVIDTAKMISAGVPVKHDVWKFFTGKKSVYSRLNLVTIPTVAGSGSEINHGAVLTHDEKQLKFGFGHRFLIPDVCIADPALTFSVSASQTGAGIVDTLCHCLEPWLSTSAKGVDLQKGFLETIARTVLRSGPACINNPRSYEDRSALLWCSMAAMSGYGSAGLGKIYFPLHAIEHPLSALTGIAHGHGLAALLPGWLQCNRERIGGQIGEWGSRVSGVTGSNGAETVDAAIAALRTFLKEVRCPVSLRDIGITPKHFDYVISHALAQARIWRLKDFSADYVKAVLEHGYRD